MKPIQQQILVVVTGCMGLTLLFSYGLSIAINHGIAQVEQRGQEFLPATQPDLESKNP